MQSSARPSMVGGVDPTKKFGDYNLQELTQSFLDFDIDENSFIGIDDLRHLFKRLKIEVTGPELQEIMKICDEYV